MTKWVLDSAHSEVNFSVKHMMIARVNGTFHEFTADIEADPADLTSAKVNFVIKTDSIDTRNGDRDAHLKSPDFFDVENFPEITFVAKEFVKKDDDEYEVVGDFSIRGVTKEKSFNVTFEGVATDPWGNEKAGFTVEGKINRADFGLTWNTALEKGGVLVGEDVKITVLLEAQKA